MIQVTLSAEQDVDYVDFFRSSPHRPAGLWLVKPAKIATGNSEAKPHKTAVELSDPFLLHPPDFHKHMSAENDVPVACGYIMA